jgi:tetratricopeptide (TPR) repeat protein
MGFALVPIIVFFGVNMFFLCMFLGILLTPAMIIVLVVSNSLLKALNPVAFGTIAYRIGWGYLLMYLFLSLLYGAPAYILNNFTSFMAPELRLFLGMAVSNYYTVISYCLMGYVILQYHEEIGYEVNPEDFTDQAPVLSRGPAAAGDKKLEAREVILNEVSILMKDGRAEDAIVVLRDSMRKGTADRVLAERYYNLLKVTGRKHEMLSHGVTYLDLLAAADDKGAACDTYRECLALDPQFIPNPEALFKIAEWCMEEGDAKTGWNAFVRFIKVNPQHGLVPKAYFLLGKNASEKLRDSARAQKAFKSLLHQFPDHELAVHARSHLEQMGKMGPASG